MKDELQQAQQRAMRYFYVDGMPEMAFGLICLLLGLCFYFEGILPKESILYKILDMSFVLIVIAGSLLVGRIIGYFKQRITYPRTGYVNYRKATGKARLFQIGFAAGLAILISVLVSILFTRAPESFAWMPAVTGIIFSAVMFFVGVRAGLLRYYLLSLLGILLGGGLSIAGIGDILGLGIFYLGMALVLLLTGGWVLISYLRHTGGPQEPFAE